jgi:hypothetical protein
MPTFSTKIAMAQKNKLTNRKTLVMVNTMSTTLAKKKTVEKFAGQKTARKLPDILQLNGEKYRIIPDEEYLGLLETIAIVSDPEAHRHVLESFADPVKRSFSSLEEIKNDLESDDEWE